jgi:hypothetical protein
VIPGRAAVRGPGGARAASASLAATLAGAVLAWSLVAACSAPPASPGPAGSPPAAASGSPAADSGAPVALPDPVTGAVIRLDAEGLTRVTGFRLRADDGIETDFRIGILENGAQFPPGHLAEHMATSTRIRVYYRDEAGERVVFRLEDAE